MKEKTNIVLIALTVALSAMVSGCEKCEKDVVDPYNNIQVPVYSDPEIEFTVADTTSQTKAITPVTSLSSFYVTATTGSAGSETSGFVNEEFSQNGSSYKGSKLWPSTNPGYHFYASNVQMTNNQAGQTVKITTIDTDVVCAYLASPTFKETNALTFDHILARVGTLAVSLNSGFTDVSVKMKYSGSGTYNLRTKAWSGVGTQQDQTLSVGANNFWIIPGTYTITLSFKDVAGNSKTKTLSKEFLAGKVNNITVSLGSSSDVVVSQATEYEDPDFTLGSIGDIPASGGNSGAPSVTGISQRQRTVYTYADGHTDNSGWTAVSDLSSSVSYCKTEGGSYVSTCPSYHADGLGTTAKERTLQGSIYVKVAANGKSKIKSTTVYQQANERTLGDMTINYSYTAIGPAAGTATPSLSYSLPYSWTSGASGNYTSDASSVTYTTVENHSAATLASDGKVSWTANTGTSRSEKERVSITLQGKTATKDAVSTQNGDGISSYENPVVTISYPSGGTIAYNSTSAVSPTITVTQTIHYSSGKVETVTLSSGDYTVSYSASSVSGLSLNTSTGVVTPTSNTGSAIAARTEYGDPSISSFSYGNIAYTGGSSSPTLSYSQSVTSYSAGRNSTSPRSLSITATVTVTANGKTGSSSACTVTQNGDPGVAVTSTTSTETSGATVSYSGSASGLSVDASSGAVTAGSNAGTGGGVSYSTPAVTFTASTTSIGYSGGSVMCNEATYSQVMTTAAISSTSQRSVTVTVTVSKHGKSATTTAICTQNGDPGKSQKEETLTSGGTVTYSVSGTGFSNSGRTITAASNAGANYTDYSTPSITAFSYPDVKAAGGTSTPTVTFSQNKTTGRRSTSSRQGTITATVSMNGKSGSASITFTQSGDSGTATTSSADISGATKSYSTVTDNTGATLNTSTGVVTWAAYSNTTTDRTETEKVTVTSNGKSASANAVSKQTKKSEWGVGDDDEEGGSGEGGEF